MKLNASASRRIRQRLHVLDTDKMHGSSLLPALQLLVGFSLSVATPAQCAAAVAQRCSGGYLGCDCSTVAGCLACAFQGFRDEWDPKGITATCTAPEVPHQDIEAACGLLPLHAPGDVRCTLLNATVEVSWNFSAGAGGGGGGSGADMFDVKLSTAPRRKPFLSYTAPAAVGDVRIDGLPSGTRLYYTAVRAHAAASPTMQAGWSHFSEPVVCVDGGDGVAAAVKAAAIVKAVSEEAAPREPSSHEPSLFVTVYRWSEGTNEVDWLENHDAGDQGGQAAYITTSSQYNDSTVVPGSYEALWPNTTLSEYCVEVLAAMPAAAGTGAGAGDATGTMRLAKGRTFSDYRSCNVELGDAALPSEAPVCQCAIVADRLIAHNQGRADDDALNASCPGVVIDGDEHHGGANCSCSVASLALSATFAGRQPVLFPWFKDSRYVNPDDDPAAAGVKPWGFWYHFPAGGRCSEGQQVGDGGCVWKRHPRARVISPGDIYAQGMNRTFQPDVGRGMNMGFDQVLANGRAMLAAFDRVAGVRRCASVHQVNK